MKGIQQWFVAESRTAEVSNNKWQRMRLVNGNSIQIKMRRNMKD
jgi:hypothetical protein